MGTEDFLLKGQTSNYVWDEVQALRRLTRATHSAQGPLTMTPLPTPLILSPLGLSRTRKQSLTLGTVGRPSEESMGPHPFRAPNLRRGT